MNKETRLDTVANGGLTWINLERPSRDMIEKEVICSTLVSDR